MNRQMRDLMRTAEGRYLTTDESRKILDLARDYERRLAIMRAIEAKESEVVRATLEKVFEKFPRFHKERPQAYERCERDVALTLRYMALAMVEGDVEVLREKLLYWFRSILSAMQMGEVPRFTYETLASEIARALPPKDAEEMAPYAKATIEALGT